VKLSEAVKPISYLKAHASEIIRDVAANRKTLVITQNGEANVVLQDIQIYEELQESLALLKLLALSKKDVREGNTAPVETAFRNARSRARRGRDRDAP